MIHPQWVDLFFGDHFLDFNHTETESISKLSLGHHSRLNQFFLNQSCSMQLGSIKPASIHPTKHQQEAKKKYLGVSDTLSKGR